jgi:UDP-glucose 4-epimerase
MRNKILLIGGSGFLGKNISKRLALEKNYITTIGDLKKPDDPNLKFLKLDILDSSKVSSLIKKYDIIINCTGQITKTINICFRLNTEGIENIITPVKLYNKKLFQISTFSVYGTAKNVNEKSDINPERSYSACKAFAEYRIIKELPLHNFCILRLPNLFGEEQPLGLFAYLLKSYKSDKKLIFNNDGTLSRYFLHVSDCADAIVKAVNKNLCGIFNVPGVEKYNLKGIISLVEEATGTRFKKKFVDIEPTENIGKIDCIAFYKATKFLPKNSILEFVNNIFLSQ